MQRQTQAQVGLTQVAVPRGSLYTYGRDYHGYVMEIY